MFNCPGFAGILWHRATERPIHLEHRAILQARDAIHLATCFFDQLAAGFDPVVGGIARERKPVPAFGEEVGADANFVVRWFNGV